MSEAYWCNVVCRLRYNNTKAAKQGEESTKKRQEPKPPAAKPGRARIPQNTNARVVEILTAWLGPLNLYTLMTVVKHRITKSTVQSTGPRRRTWCGGPRPLLFVDHISAKPSMKAGIDILRLR